MNSHSRQCGAMGARARGPAKRELDERRFTPPDIEARPSASGARRRSYTRGSEVGDRCRPEFETITITIITEYSTIKRRRRRGAYADGGGAAGVAHVATVGAIRDGSVPRILGAPHAPATNVWAVDPEPCRCEMKKQKAHKQEDSCRLWSDASVRLPRLTCACACSAARSSGSRWSTFR